MSTAQRILLVDDETDSAEMLAEFIGLRGLGEARCARDALDALDQARAFVPTMVLLDLALPGAVDGCELARRLRTVTPGATLIAVSGYADAAHKRRALAAGCSAYVSKPIHFPLLEMLLTRARPPDAANADR